MPMAGADEFRLPAPGVMVNLSPEFNPPILKGLKVHPENPFRFDFILDKGELPAPSLKEESSKLIRYFLASLTIPEGDLWVNLSPYEKNRIIPTSFGLTEMGRDLLAEDYLLKQITASLIYPEGEVGKKFWKRIYEQASKKFGTTNIPVNTFNKVWIVPEKAVVYENARAGTAYVVESKLKVMLDQDYLSLSKHIDMTKGANDVSALGCQIVREIVIPELTKEVNEGKNFAQLRQVYNSVILATWYKKKIKDGILARVYADKNKIAGVGYQDGGNIETIYQRYLQAFKKGVYNYIKEEQDPRTQETIPRKYFSGGVGLTALDLDSAMTTTTDTATVPSPINEDVVVQSELKAVKPENPLPGDILLHSSLVPFNSLTGDMLSDVKIGIEALAKKEEAAGTMVAIPPQTWTGAMAQDRSFGLSQVFLDREGEVIGFVLAYPDTENHIAVISKLAVDERYRKSGIATLLVNALARQAKTMGLGKIDLNVFKTNTIAQEAYQVLGFRNSTPAEYRQDPRFKTFVYDTDTTEFLNKLAPRLDDLKKALVDVPQSDPFLLSDLTTRITEAIVGGKASAPGWQSKFTFYRNDGPAMAGHFDMDRLRQMVNIGRPLEYLPLQEGDIPLKDITGIEAQISPKEEDVFVNMVPYVISNEIRREGTIEILRDASADPDNHRVHIGVSLMFDFDVMAARRSALGIVVDRNGRLGEVFSKINELLTQKQTLTRREFTDRLIDWFKKDKQRQGNQFDLYGLLNSSANSWLSTDQDFEFIREKFLAHKVLFIRSDWRNVGVFRAIGVWLKKNGLRADTVYVSNMRDWLLFGDSGRNVSAMEDSLRAVSDPNTFVIDAAKQGASVNPALSQRVMRNGKVIDRAMQANRATNVKDFDGLNRWLSRYRFRGRNLFGQAEDVTVSIEPSINGNFRSRHDLNGDEGRIIVYVPRYFSVYAALNDLKRLDVLITKAIKKDYRFFVKITGPNNAVVHRNEFFSALHVQLNSLGKGLTQRIPTIPSQKQDRSMIALGLGQVPVWPVELAKDGDSGVIDLVSPRGRYREFTFTDGSSITGTEYQTEARNVNVWEYKTTDERIIFHAAFHVDIDGQDPWKTVFAQMTRGLQEEKRKPAGLATLHDLAMNAGQLPAEKGGIDLTANKMPLEIQNTGQEIKFQLNPTQLEALRNAPGFEPVIINIQPLTDLKGFLEVNH